MSNKDTAALPKAELHVHLEGTIEPEDMLGFAHRNGHRLPWQSPDELRAAYRFTDLADFLALYWQGCQALVTRDDFYDLAMNYLRRAAVQGVRWVELSFAPQNFLPRGISIDDQFGGITAAIADAHTEWGIGAGIVVVVQRHKTEAEAFDLLDVIRPHRADLVGIGLGGPEVGHPPSKFARMFTAARNDGYRMTAHAGEEGPPEYVREALACGVERIDHGFTAIRDQSLVQQLADQQTPLTLCPLSNLRLRLLDDLRKYPLHSFLDAGVSVSINSDDPPYFGGKLNDNYTAVTDALSLDSVTVAQLARNSFTGSFAPADTITAGLQAIRARTGGA